MIKSTTEKHTLGWLERANNAKKLDFNIAIQRKEVWDIEHKSNLIASALIGIPIESFLFEEEIDSDNYLVLDGKQRSTSFLQYLRDEYAISSSCKIEKVNGEVIIGKKFSELSNDLKETLKETELTFSVLRPLTEDEREIIFFMRNQAVALSKVELTRVLLGSKAMERLQDLCKHEFLDKTNISRKRYLDQQVILEFLLLESGKDYGFSGRDMNLFAEELKHEGISDEVNSKLIAVMDYLNDSILTKNRSLRKIHIPMIYFVARKALKNGVQTKAFGEWVNTFFEDIKGDVNEYTFACNNGSAMKANVQKRLVYIMEHYNNNIKKGEI